MYFKTLVFIFTISITGFMSCNDKSIEDQMVEAPDKENNPDDSLSYKEKAKETYEMIQRLYTTGDLYKENYPAQQGENRYSYLWPYVGMVSAGNVLYELGYDEAILRKEFSGLEAYYDDREILPSYQAYVFSEQQSDHYYDDASIVVMELIDAYRLTEDPFFLNRAKTVTEFIMSGEDSRMGGGLYWLESVSKDCTDGSNCLKAANTSAYAAYVTSEMYKITDDQKYLDFAKRVYDWTYNTLRDHSDNLYWNDISIATGQISIPKWTYNAGMMIMSGVSLYEVTGEEHYKTEAISTARSSFSNYTNVVNDQLFFPTHDSWFNVELMTAFIALSKYDSTSKSYVEVFIKNADYAWNNARNSEGQFYEDWTGNSQGRYFWLLHQAALVEAFGRIAIFKNET
jgi:hypothetical protein